MQKSLSKFLAVLRPCGQSNCYWDIRSWRVPFGIWASRSMTLWKFRSRLKSRRHYRPRAKRLDGRWAAAFGDDTLCVQSARSRQSLHSIRLLDFGRSCMSTMSHQETFAFVYVIHIYTGKRCGLILNGVVLIWYVMGCQLIMRVTLVVIKFKLLFTW